MVTNTDPSLALRMHTDRIQRIFSFANQIDYVLESIALVAALGSGTALALVNLVFGMFVTLISDYASGASSPAKFRNDATKAR